MKSVSLVGPDKTPAELRLDGDRLYVEQDGVQRDALTGSTRLEVGRISDTLHVDRIKFEVPRGQGGTVKAMFAEARLGAPRPVAIAADLLVDDLDDRSKGWLAEYLEADELLLAWVEADDPGPLPSPYLEKAETMAWLCVTDRRAALVEITEVGDVRARALADPIENERALGRAAFSSGEIEWRSTRRNQDEHRDAVKLAAVAPSTRRVALAKLMCDGGKADRAAARPLLSSILHPLARLAEWTLTVDGDPEPDITEAALALDASPGALDAWAAAWDPKPKRMLEVVTMTGESAESLALHKRAHAALTKKKKKDSVDRVVHDVRLAAHELSAGRAEDAIERAEEAMKRLPDADLIDLLPPDDVDLTDGTQSATLRTALLDIVAKAKGEGPQDHPSTQLTLAQLQPLLPARLRAAKAHVPDRIKDRIDEAIALLLPGGVGTRETERPPVKALAKDTIEDSLRHPATRQGHWLASIQSYLASSPAPDHEALKDYCERLNPDRDRVAQEVLSDAALMLGVPAVEGYVSRGEKSIGVRAYEGAPPFMLVGADHLAEGNQFSMSKGELRFVFASEIAHLRFEHTRVTSSAVWDGALEKSKSALGLVAGVLPALKGVKFLTNLTRVGEMYERAGALGGTLAALASRSKPAKSRRETITQGTEELIATHRAMQLTADRAGLVLSRDLAASVRAMFLLRPDYRAELPLVERNGLAEVLARRKADGSIMYQDLAVRVAALIAFALTDEYAALTSAPAT